jgi:hypothetical protein
LDDVNSIFLQRIFGFLWPLPSLRILIRHCAL